MNPSPEESDFDTADMPAMSQADQEALTWFTRLRQPVSKPTHAEFAEWLAKNPANAQAYQKINRFWDSDGFNRALVLADNSNPAKANNRLRWLPKPAWAAAASLLLAAGLAYQNGLWQSLSADASTAVGEQRQLTLADGSTVLLDTGSALAIHYQSNRRAVELLRGRAFFNVRPDAAKPFVVVTTQASVQVVGTRFSVNTDGDLPLAVQQGTVKFLPATGAGQLTVQAGEQVQLEHERPYLSKQSDSSAFFEWTEGRLIFREQPLQAVLAEVDRYQPGLIVLTNHALAGTKVTGNYKLAKPAHILNSLAAITGATVYQVTPYLTVIN